MVQHQPVLAPYPFCRGPAAAFAASMGMWSRRSGDTPPAGTPGRAGAHRHPHWHWRQRGTRTAAAQADLEARRST